MCGGCGKKLKMFHTFYHVRCLQSEASGLDVGAASSPSRPREATSGGGNATSSSVWPRGGVASSAGRRRTPATAASPLTRQGPPATAAAPFPTAMGLTSDGRPSPPSSGSTFVLFLLCCAALVANVLRLEHQRRPAVAQRGVWWQRQ